MLLIELVGLIIKNINRNRMGGRISRESVIGVSWVWNWFNMSQMHSLLTNILECLRLSIIWVSLFLRH